MSRAFVSRLGAIGVKTGPALPWFSWSLASTDHEAKSPQEVSFPEATADVEEQDLRHFINTHVREGRKVFFMGEHHQQPRVLAAQLTILDELAKHAEVAKKPVILVAEQFNVLQRTMLQKFCTVPDQPEEGNDREAAAQLMEDYAEDAGEGFDLSHYMPLLLLARTLKASVVGGFPPRAWAGIVYKQGVDALKNEKGKELETIGFDRWNDLKCSSQHAAYLKSLMSGDPPVLPGGDPGEQPQKAIHTAQAFKDAMLAFVIDEELRRSPDGAIVLVVTGSGHCEYGYGGPERLQRANRKETSILVCKSNQESTVWQGERWGRDAQDDDRILADAVFCYDQA